MSPEDRRDLMLQYAAGALDAEASAELRAAIERGDPSALAALAEAEAVLAKLPEALPPVVPPPSAVVELRRRLDAVEAGAPPRARPSKTTWTGWGVAAALALAAAGLWYFANQRAEVLNDELAAVRGEMADRRELLAALATPTGRVAILPGTESQPGAGARLIYDPENNQAFVFAHDVGPAPAGQTYQLWVVTDDDRKVSVGTFTPDADGNVSVRFVLPADPGPVSLGAVTNEPAGGSPQPTGAFQLVGEF